MYATSWKKRFWQRQFLVNFVIEHPQTAAPDCCIISPKSYNIFLSNCNEFHNILRLFDVLPKFHSTTNETMSNYYLEMWYLQVSSGANQRLKT